jgi:hypothetical protein
MKALALALLALARPAANPDHADYRYFRLRLTGVSDGGASGWRRLLSAHFENCPAAAA